MSVKLGQVLHQNEVMYDPQMNYLASDLVEKIKAIEQEVRKKRALVCRWKREVISLTNRSLLVPCVVEGSLKGFSKEFVHYFVCRIDLIEKKESIRSFEKCVLALEKRKEELLTKRFLMFTGALQGNKAILQREKAKSTARLAELKTQEQILSEIKRILTYFAKGFKGVQETLGGIAEMKGILSSDEWRDLYKIEEARWIKFGETIKTLVKDFVEIKRKEGGMLE